VSREELQKLEFVTADHMFDNGGNLPCPMASLQGVNLHPMPDPFAMAENVSDERVKKKAAEAKKKIMHKKQLDKFQNRILEAFDGLTDYLRLAGWGKK